VYLSLLSEQLTLPISAGRIPCICSLVLWQAYTSTSPCPDIMQPETVKPEQELFSDAGSSHPETALSGGNSLAGQGIQA